MATTVSVKLVPKFADGSTGTALTFGNFAQDANTITSLKANVMMFNDLPDGEGTPDEGEDFASNFVNDKGSKWQEWSEAHIITTERVDYAVSTVTTRF